MTALFAIGDILHADNNLDAIAHGCNAKGIMGAGIAKDIRFKYPHMYRAYRRGCLSGQIQLGDCYHWASQEDPDIFNLITQESPGPYVTKQAIIDSMMSMLGRAKELGIKTIAMPTIGCGLGGLKWDEEVRPLLVDLAENSSINVVICENFVQGKPIQYVTTKKVESL